MQLNTRNFLLYALSVAFLLVAITLTVVSDVTGERVAHSPLTVFSSQEAAVFTATQVEPTPTLDREKNLAAMREKIADLDFSAVVSSELIAEPETTTTSVVSAVSDVVSCSAPVAQEVRWPARGVKFEVVEGARIVYLDPVVGVDGLSGEPLVTASATREVLLQLPLHSTPLSSKSCPTSDVVGVALDGSLIRNTEYPVYAIFGSESLIGYALDGFPIYGLSDGVVDQCGGKSVDGQYGYYLRPDQTVVLDCFFGKPVNL